MVRPAGDVNADCTVNIIDLVIVAGSFGKSVGTPGYNPIADVNYDEKADIIDLSIVGSSFGQSCEGDRWSPALDCSLRNDLITLAKPTVDCPQDEMGIHRFQD